MLETVKIAVIWARFGAYHLARFESLRCLLRSQGGDAFGIEVASSDAIYEWSRLNSTDDGRMTLFAERSYEQLKPKEIRSALKTVLDREDPDVVATNGYQPIEAREALSWCRRNDKSCILMSESKWDDMPRWRLKEWAKGCLVRRFDAALVGGEPHRDYLVRLGMPRTTIAFGYNAVDNRYFAKGSAKACKNAVDLRRALGLPTRYFFACTRFLPRKNVDGLLRGYATLSEDERNRWGLVIAGSGDESGRLQAIVRDLKLDNVMFPGFVQYDQLPVYFGLANAFVHPAKSEPWGLVVNEAAACGLPLLVARPVGSAATLVEEGHNGYLFDPFDEQSIAASLSRLIGLDDDRRREMGGQSKRIVARWGPDRFAEGMLEAIGRADSMGNTAR